MIAILYNIRSLHNVGSIFRTADAAGIELLYLVGITPSPSDRFGIKRQALSKVSLGAENFVAWEKVRSGTNLLRKLRAQNLKIYAIEQSPKSIPYFKVNLATNHKDKIALVVGNEIKGLSPAVLKFATKSSRSQ